MFMDRSIPALRKERLKARKKAESPILRRLLCKNFLVRNRESNRDRAPFFLFFSS